METMTELYKEREWTSVHSNYIEFALQSLAISKDRTLSINTTPGISRPALEAIRYAYDVIDASIEFVHHMGIIHQLRLRPPDTWLTRYVNRKWSEKMSLCDRLGLLAYSWVKSEFWQSKEQLQLFMDLKKLRDGLTHPRPAGVETTEEILNEIRNLDAVFTWSRDIGEPVVITAKHLVNEGKAIAEFANMPDKLTSNDADQAIEIMLWHLSRMDDLFFGGPSTEFAVYDSKAKKVISARELLQASSNKFAAYWKM